MKAEIKPAKEDEPLGEPNLVFNVKDFDLSNCDEKKEYCDLINSGVEVQKRTNIVYESKLIVWLEYWEEYFEEKKKDG